MNTRLLSAAAAAACAAATAHAGNPIYGIKSIAPAGGGPSGTQSDLYVFQPDGSGFTVLGRIVLNTGQLDADALAISPTHGLMCYFNTAGGWNLASLSLSGDADRIGVGLPGRDIRGAVFDGDDRLWVLDAANDELLRIDPLTGAVLSSVGLHTASGPLDLTNTTDLAIRADGLVVLSSLADFYQLNVTTGLCTPLGTHPANALAGLAFANGAPAQTLFGYEINTEDDIFTYDTFAAFAPTLLIPDIIPSYNSGRGDLASLLDALPGGCNPADIAPPFGLLDLADVNAFVSGFVGMDPIADLDDNGLFDLGDVNLFVTSFVGGCP